MAILSADTAARMALKLLVQTPGFRVVVKWLEDNRDSIVQKIASETEADTIVKLSGSLEVLQSILTHVAESTANPEGGQ